MARPFTITAVLVCWVNVASAAAVPWPPPLRGANQGVVRIETKAFLEVPAAVATGDQAGAAPFVVAKQAPVVDVVFHGDLGPDAATRQLWSSWGDICVSRDGSVYVGIGDHGDDAGGDARCFLYRWNPQAKTLTQIVDMGQVVTPRPGQPAWSKVHAKIDEAPDGKIYFSTTLNDGSAAGQEKFHWTAELPGGQLYQYDPQTKKTVVFSSLPSKRCTATSLLDSERNIWWCNLEAGAGDAMFGLDLATRKVVYQSADGAVGFNRNFAMAVDGTLYFNGKDGKILHLDPASGKITETGSILPESAGMRASSLQSSQGDIFGATHGTYQLFRFRPGAKQLEMLGPTWGKGEYTTVMVLSPDERFLYYLPGAHGQAAKYGTPVVQYEIATRTRKVLAFLAPVLEERIDYVPGGTYGVKLSADGGTLYVNFNGHAGDKSRPADMRPNGFGLTSFVAIEIPKSER